MLCKIVKRSFVGVAAIFPLFAWQNTVSAQEATTGRTIPDSFAPEKPVSKPSVQLGGNGSLKPPSGSEEIFVTIADVIVEGASEELDNAIQELVKNTKGRRRSVADLYRLASNIEALHVRQGQVLTRAVVPPQELDHNSKFRIRIIQGYIERVDVSALPENVKKPVANQVSALERIRGITLEEIERHLLLADRVPGVRLKSALAPGSEPGGAILVLNADYDSLSAYASVDNELSSAFGHWRTNVYTELNSPLGRGGRAYGYISTGKDFQLFGDRPYRRVIALGAAVPLGKSPASLHTDYVQADTTPITTPGVANTKGRFERYEIRLEYPITLTRQEQFHVSGSFEIVNETQQLPDFDTDLSKDKLRILSLQTRWSRAWGNGGIVDVDAEVAKGLDIWDARNQGDVASSGIPLSRFRAEPDFLTVKGRVRYSRAVAEKYNVAVIARGQLSTTGALPGAAQFGIDGRDSARGFDLGALSADSGFTTQMELSSPGALALSRTVQLTPYTFASYGYGYLDEPTALEADEIDAWSVGGGISFGLSNRVSGFLEGARTDANTFQNPKSRIMFSIGLSL